MSGNAVDESSADGAVELTILMPCLNEAETVAVCVTKAIEFLARAGIAGEVLIADNGSIDGSQELALASGARVVAVPEKGYGSALIGGIRAAKGRYIIMGDADDSYDFLALTNLSPDCVAVTCLSWEIVFPEASCRVRCRRCTDIWAIPS